jgi:aryl-alcohol dehydrogenase-like predicted oxidoreductase
MDKVRFGDTGLLVSPLAFGTGTSGWAGSSAQTRLGFQRLVDLLRLGYDLGITFWDLADQYGSHPHAAAALKGLDRASVVIATKSTSRSRQGMESDIRRFLRELNTDYLDIVLMHYVTDPRWPGQYVGAMEALARAKEQGLIRAVGASFHNLDALRVAASCDWLDVALVRINDDGRSMDGTPSAVAAVIEQLAAAGKAVYGMKVLGLGALPPERAIPYVLSLPGVSAVTIGMCSEEEIRQNVDVVTRWQRQHIRSGGSCYDDFANTIDVR